MADMAKGLERDPQLESLFAGRKVQLGIAIETWRSLGADLAMSHGLRALSTSPHITELLVGTFSLRTGRQHSGGGFRNRLTSV